MAGSLTSALAPIIFLAVVLTADVWVYRDGQAQSSQGAPAFFRFGTFAIDTPAAKWRAVQIYSQRNKRTASDQKTTA